MVHVQQAVQGLGFVVLCFKGGERCRRIRVLETADVCEGTEARPKDGSEGVEAVLKACLYSEHPVLDG